MYNNKSFYNKQNGKFKLKNRSEDSQLRILKNHEVLVGAVPWAFYSDSVYILLFTAINWLTILVSFSHCLAAVI